LAVAQAANVCRRLRAPPLASSRCNGRISAAFSATIKFSGVTVTRLAAQLLDFGGDAQGSTTTPLPDHRQLAGAHHAGGQQTEL